MDEPRLARKARIAELLLDAARQLGETLEPERVYARFHELLEHNVPHDGLVVSSYDERDDLIRCDYAWVEGNVVDAGTLPPLSLNREGGGMQSRVIVTGEAAIFNDVEERVHDAGGQFYSVDREGTVQEIPESGPAGTTAAMMVPVKHEGRVVGVVQVMRDTGAYSEEELELVEGLVGQMGAAVRNARLQRERSRLEAAEAAALAVAAEREQAAQVLDAVGEGIVLADSGGVVRVWNLAAELITGVRAGAAVGRPLVEALPEWEWLAPRIPVADHGETPRSVALPVGDLWLSFVAVRGLDGVVYAFRDLTLERRVEELQSEFVATISHELRTPMAGVYGAAETLLHRDAELSDEQRRQLLEMIATQASRLKAITEAVLLTSSLERGELALERAPVDVAELVRSTVDALGPAVADVSVEAEPSAGAAYGDRDRIQQVLVNLLDNAVKYGGGPVSIRVDGGNGYVRVAVSDEGPGIPQSEQRRIFEKFYRSDPQQTRSPGGTGLGLYIARELVRRMDGRLEVRSAPGEGATFVVELPRA